MPSIFIFSDRVSNCPETCQFGEAACQRTSGSSCCCMPSAGIDSVWHYTRLLFVDAWAQTQLLLLIACTLLSPKTPGFNFAKVKTVPIVCLCRPTPLLPPLYPLPGFSHQIPCIAFWLTVGSVSKVRTLASSEIHDGLGSWHGDERSRPQ